MSDSANKKTGRSIVPRANVAGNALALTIAIMAFLASLTLGAVSLVADTARSWQSDIAREITVQLRPLEGQDMAANLERAQEIIASFSGVTGVSVFDDPKVEQLLAPWLGDGLDLKELPVPVLIAVRIDETAPPDFDTMRAALSNNVPGASLDDHRAWIDRLTTMASATIVIGFIIFALMLAATVLTVIFATRGAMAGNRHVIDVLHFVGAEPRRIAAEFQKHFLLLGLKGAIAGGACAVIAFLIFGWWTRRNAANPAADQVNALFGTFSVGLAGYVGTIILVFVIALIAALTSRMTVMRHVGTLDGTRAGR